MTMLLISILITFLYGVLILLFFIGFHWVQPFHVKKVEAKNTFSILVPFRNEAAAIPALLKSIAKLQYSNDKYELIFINDDSDDESVVLLNEFIKKRSVDSTQSNIRIINNSRKTDSPKKDAINTAIHQATFDWIITTDADCIVPEKWLQILDRFIEEKQPQLIVAPVTYNSTNRFLEQFQLLDFLSLQGSTIGGFGIQKPFLCNGANLCYSKQTFFDVNGFEGNTNIASGDDIFLLEKIVAKYPNKVHYLKSNEAIVITKPQPTCKQLLDQRVRWAAKSTAYKNWFSKLVSIVVLLMNMLLIVLFFSSLFSYTSWSFFILIFGIKFTVDILLLFKTTSFFKQQKVLVYYVLSSLLYPVFIMFVVIASLSSGYSWKGRQFKK
jgi:biofilm PGA synthesis N-glycosyltransferase PgaC